MSIENDWMKIHEWSPPYSTDGAGRMMPFYARRSALKWVQPSEVMGVACYNIQVGARILYTLENPMPDLEDL